MLARPWLAPASRQGLLQADRAALAALGVGAVCAVLLWAGPRGLRAPLAGALALSAWWLPQLSLVVLPTTAALATMPAATLDELRIGGVGLARLTTRVILPVAAPGLLAGLALCLAPGPIAGRLAAAALPLLLTALRPPG